MGRSYYASNHHYTLILTTFFEFLRILWPQQIMKYSTDKKYTAANRLNCIYFHVNLTQAFSDVYSEGLPYVVMKEASLPLYLKPTLLPTFCGPSRLLVTTSCPYTTSLGTSSTPAAPTPSFISSLSFCSEWQVCIYCLSHVSAWFYHSISKQLKQQLVLRFLLLTRITINQFAQSRNLKSLSLTPNMYQQTLSIPLLKTSPSFSTITALVHPTFTASTDRYSSSQWSSLVPSSTFQRTVWVVYSALSNHASAENSF